MYSNSNYSSQYHKQAVSKNKTLIQKLFNNNSFMLKKHKKTLSAQIRELNQQQIKINRNTVYKLKSGENNSCSITFLQYFALYWNRTLEDMLILDFEELDEQGRLELTKFHL